jgi:hypothetical protein
MVLKREATNPKNPFCLPGVAVIQENEQVKGKRVAQRPGGGSTAVWMEEQPLT